MHAGTLRALEFDRIVAVVAGLAVTPTGREHLARLHPMTDPLRIQAAQRATTEGTRFLADHPGFPLRAPADLEEILEALAVEGRALEPLRLLGLSAYLESIDQSRSLIRSLGPSFPILSAAVDAVASFKGEIAATRRQIDASGEIADDASPALARIRERLRRQRAKLRTTLEAFLRGRDTAKYLQEQVVTDRNGRYVLMVRAEHRSAIPGVVHGASASGASLFLEPLTTVEINNDIVALEEDEREEVQRILLALTDAFRARSADLHRSLDVATELDDVQARARFSIMVDGVEPAASTDGTIELRAARHPLLMRSVADRLGEDGGDEARDETAERSRPHEPVPVDILLTPPVRVLVIAGPNTGGKTVALKTTGLFAAMAQAGLHLPAERGSRLPTFRRIFADIGDEQSISASLSTFSAHVSNIVGMYRELALPALILLDEIGAGTDPMEGGALGTAVLEHFRLRGAHLVATTHYDALKSYAATTEGVASAAFGFDPETFAPSYRLMYGSPGRSLAIEIAARLGMPAAVIAAARENLTDREKQLAEHLARIDRELHNLEQDRRALARERAAHREVEGRLRSREEAVRQREETVKGRLDARLDNELREARREIDSVIEELKARTAELTAQATRRAAASVSTGEAGAARAGARTAVERIVGRLKSEGSRIEAPRTESGPPPAAAPMPGARVSVGGLGLEGEVIDVHGAHAEVNVRGKRLRAPLRDLRVIGAPRAAKVDVRIDLQPREVLLSDLNVIGCTSDEAITRTERFIDESMVTDQRVLRLIHGHGTGQLRRALHAFLKEHPLVARFHLAPTEQGGGGVTVVELKE